MSDYNDDSDIWPDPVVAERIRQKTRQECDLIGHVAKICRGYGHVYKPGAHLDQTVVDMRVNLIEEEAQETAQAFGYAAPDWDFADPGMPVVDPVALADGLVDTVVVCIGGLIELFGESCARDLWAEVQRSNEAKIGPLGEVVRREDGKVLKPEGWTPPDIESVLKRHGIAGV